MKEKAKRLEKLYNQLSKPPIDKSISELINSERKENIIYNPTYGRNFVWNNTDSTDLIETILIHAIIPPIVVLETDNGMEIIDRKAKI